MFSLATGVASFVGNVKAGNVGAAIIDGVGIIADAAAVALPCVPGGVGAGIKAGRGAAKLADGISTANKLDNATSAGNVIRKTPIANGGKGPTHGKIDHNSAIDNRVRMLENANYTDIRKNQVQVDANGNIVGNNRPDLQGTSPNGQREYFEFDRSAKNSQQHGRKIQANDPKGKVNLEILP